MTFRAGAFGHPAQEVPKNLFQTSAPHKKYHTFDSGHESSAVAVDGGLGRTTCGGFGAARARKIRLKYFKAAREERHTSNRNAL